MSRAKFRARSWGVHAGFAALIVLFAWLANTPRTVSPVWYGPYLSAAVNVEWGGDFRINLTEVTDFTDLPDADRYGYRFTSTDNLELYNANPIGFAYTIAVAKRLFEWLPDLEAVESFQILVHTLMCLVVIALLGRPAHKLLFFVLYAINPLVIYFVTNPIYFMYQALPSFALLTLLLSRQHWSAQRPVTLGVCFAGLSAILAIAVLIRPTTIGAVAAFFVLALTLLKRRAILLAGVAVFAIVAVTGYSPNQKNFWHTPYVGIGAYPNSHMQGLSDDNGYALFMRKTGTDFSASLGGKYYTSEGITRYRNVTREEYLRILGSEWPLLLRNAMINVLQGFSIGYMVGQAYWIQYAIAATGLSFLALLAVSRQFILIGLIVMTNVTFALYFPPIPAYMYGAYMLLVYGFIGVLDFFGVTAWLERRRGPHKAQP